MSIYEKLTKVQNELKAPKNRYNSFGKYKYRSCEDILEAVKPLLLENKLAMTITDEVIDVAERFYVVATVTVFDTESEAKLTTTAYAREDLDKKGMDGSQITGSTSSYARKYALNGMFAIDDTEDSDTQDPESTKVKDKSAKELKEVQAAIVKRCGELGGTKNTAMMSLLKTYSSNGNPNNIKDLAKAKELYEKLSAMKQ